MSDLTLSAEELKHLTGGYEQPAAQLRELHRQGFYRARRSRVTGEVILERAHYDAVAAGSSAPARLQSSARPKLRSVT